MESLSRFLSASPPFPNPSKTLNPSPNSHIFFSNYIPNSSNSTSLSSNFRRPHSPPSYEIKTPNHKSYNTSRTTILSENFHKDFFSLNSQQMFFKSNLFFLWLGFSSPLSSFASEITSLPTDDVSNKINLESILVSIDNFFNRYPFFVAAITFIWLVVIPLSEEYLQKYKFISAINAFKKLQDDPNCQLLDIRDSKSLDSLGSPNLKILNKSSVQVEFREGDEDDFVKRVLENFREPANTILCIVDNFDGKSMKVAELLVKNGLKEAYAIRGGLRGENGWQEIQETLLPPSVHVYPKKGRKLSKPLDSNGRVTAINKDLSTSASSNANSNIKEIRKEDFSSISPNTVKSNFTQRPSSPYPNYPDYKPPSSPTPSKPS